MTELRGSRTADAPVDTAAALEATRSGAESRVVARSILERGRIAPRSRLAQLANGAVDEGEHGDPASGSAAAPDASVADTSASDISPPDTEEFLQLFQEYERYVASIGSRILGSNNGVDDLVQDVFLVIYQEFHKLRELSSVKAWLATIATRLAWRQRGRPWLYSKLSLAQMEELSPMESTDASPELQADLSTLLERLRSMPATLREPWLLRFIDGETLPRIAELCECSQSTVQRRLREAGEVMLGEKLSS